MNLPDAELDALVARTAGYPVTGAHIAAVVAELKLARYRIKVLEDLNRCTFCGYQRGSSNCQSSPHPAGAR